MCCVKKKKKKIRILCYISCLHYFLSRYCKEIWQWIWVLYLTLQLYYLSKFKSLMSSYCSSTISIYINVEEMNFWEFLTWPRKCISQLVHICIFWTLCALIDIWNVLKYSMTLITWHAMRTRKYVMLALLIEVLLSQPLLKKILISFMTFLLNCNLQIRF